MHHLWNIKGLVLFAIFSLVPKTLFWDIKLSNNDLFLELFNRKDFILQDESFIYNFCMIIRFKVQVFWNIFLLSLFEIEVGPPFSSSSKNQLQPTLRWDFFPKSKTQPFFKSKKIFPHKRNYPGLIRSINHINWSAEFKKLNVDESYEKFLTKKNEWTNEFIPTVKVRIWYHQIQDILVY